MYADRVDYLFTAPRYAPTVSARLTLPALAFQPRNRSTALLPVARRIGARRIVAYRFCDGRLRVARARSAD
jgi:hypothetical protein